MKPLDVSKVMNFFHLSTENHDGEWFVPRVPANRMPSEDDHTPRVCFADELEGAFEAICPAYRDEYCLYVHVPDNLDELIEAGAFFDPDEEDVPDVGWTGEIWCLEPVRMRCISLIFIGYRHNGIEYDVVEYDPDINTSTHDLLVKYFEDEKKLDWEEVDIV